MSLPKPHGSGACYVAGRMTGEPLFGRAAFIEARGRWEAAGWKVCDPIEFDDSEYGGPELASAHVPYETLLLRDLQRINGCDAVVVLPNWKDSRGARLEVHWAHATGKPVYEADTGAALWANAFVPPTPETGETRVVSSTGGAKGQKLARYDLMPPFALKCVVEHFGKGALKYTTPTQSGERNWERGYPWSLNFAALNRHLWAWWGGETLDPETQSNHMTAVAWHALVLLEFSKTHPEFDDRPKA